jgi:hypothetical protein
MLRYVVDYENSMPFTKLRHSAFRIGTLAITVCLVVAALTKPAHAQRGRRDDPRRAQVAAATENAIASLREQIVTKQLRRNLTVQTFLDETAGNNDLNRLLARSQLIGGPRVIDDDGTTQVRLEISGARVAQLLLLLGSSKADWASIKPDALAVELQSWNRLTFSAIGTSTGAAGAVNAMPPPREQAGAWKDVDEETRRGAIALAKNDAVSRVITSVEPSGLSAAVTVRDLFTSEPKVREELDAWLASRPVTRIDFRDDLSVEVTLAALPGDAFDAFKTFVPAGDKFDWASAREHWIARMAPPVGIARVQRGQNPILASTMPRPAIVLPARAPDWVTQEIEAEGTAAAQDTKLKTARLAESDATNKLREQIAELSLTHELSLGAAARDDARIAEAIDRALNENAQTVESKYRPDGSASVRVALSLRDLWDEMRRAQ